MFLEHVSRKQAFLTHLSVSMMVFLIMLYVIAFQWFPSFYYSMDNGYMGTGIMFFVDVVLGPGLTLLVFKQGKKSLKFDLTVIIIIQLLALSWGIKSVYEGRPALTVFYNGKMTLMSHSDVQEVDMESIENGASGNQNLAYLSRPKEVRERSSFQWEALLNKSSEIFYYGSKFEPVSKSNMHQIAEYELDIDAVEKESSAAADVLKKYINEHPGYRERYYLYPIGGRFDAGIAVLDIEVMRIVEVLDVQTREIARLP